MISFTSNDTARMWAANSTTSETEAFETAIKRIKPEDTIHKLTIENAELRDMIKEQAEQICRLREALHRQLDDHFEYE